MKIGVFDSGLGGLITLQAITKKLPEYDYLYLGDTKRVPYGNRSKATIYQFLKEGVDFLARKNCALIIVACNTASAEALRTLQQKYLPKKYPSLRVLGMIVPIVEECASYKKVGIIGTQATIASGAYPREFRKRVGGVQVHAVATPLLVPIIESGDMTLIPKTLTKYLRPFKNIEALILGCTHYPLIKKQIRNILPSHIRIVAQDTIIPRKTKEYLARHPEIEKRLSKKGARALYTTDITPTLRKLAEKWFGQKTKIHLAHIEN